MSEKLKPCPFCGGKAIMEIVPPHKHFIANMPDYGGGAFIECLGCSCGIAAETEDEAIAAWNQRDDKIRELVLDFLDDWTTNPCRLCGKTHYDGDDKCTDCHVGRKIKAIREALK